MFLRKRPNFFRPAPRIRRLGQVESEARFLAGRKSRLYELFRLTRIANEFIRGFMGFHRIGPAVSVFGSARFHEGHPYYSIARLMGSALAREGFTVMTGGGPGLMEAANRGAKEAGGESVGCSIVLPREMLHNAYLDKVITFYYFFVRKVMLVKYSYAFVIMPGGLGTLDEMSEAMTLIQTGKLYDFPVILMGSDYWKGLMDWIQGTLIKEKAVNTEDLTFLHITDDPEEALRIIQRTVQGIHLKLSPLPVSAD